MAPSRRVAAAAAALLFLLTTLIGVSCESLISSHQQIKRNSDEYLNGDPDPGFSQRGTCQEEGVHVSGQGSQRGVQADLSTRLRSGMGGQGSPKVRQLSERGAQLAALEGNLLEQEELVLSLVRLLETQRDQISQLLSEAGSQDCSCPCRQLADWRQNRAQEKSLLITLQEPTSGSGLTKGPVNDDVASPVVVAPQGEPSEIMSASVAKSAAFGGALVGYQERLVVRPRVAWADHFKLLAAVQVGAQVTCLHAVQQVKTSAA